MNDLRDLFDEALGTPPPNRLAAAELYAAGRRRHRLRTASATAAAVLAGVLVLGAGLLLPGRMSQSLPPAADPSTAATPARDPIQWAGAYDADHLYLTHLACPGGECPKTTVQLRGSRDGGATWTDRGEPVDAIALAAVAPETLVASRPAGADGERRLDVSTDGGRSWLPSREVAAVDAVPAGAAVVCWAATGERCTLWTVDPDSGTRAPLRHQPELLADPAGLLPQRSGDRIWLGGGDSATGRPAVAVSEDAGRTWSVHTFVDTAGCPPEGCRPVALAAGGPWAYAVTPGAAYRYASENARWERMPAPPPDRGDHSFVAADGTHVLCQLVSQPDGRDGCRFAAGRDGGYHPIELVDLPATVHPIRRTPDGWFYTYGYTDRRLFGSADGWTWSAISAR